jgi:hypothetical protein
MDWKSYFEHADKTGEDSLNIFTDSDGRPVSRAKVKEEARKVLRSEWPKEGRD